MSQAGTPAQVSKSEALRRYLERPNGDLPETLDALHDSGNEFLPLAQEDDLGINAPTIVRNRRHSPTIEEKKVEM
ncbi:unnamed protein product, partial [Protopolystoma xenopodis]